MIDRWPPARANQPAISSRLSSIVLLNTAEVSANSRITAIVSAMFVATTLASQVNSLAGTIDVVKIGRGSVLGAALGAGERRDRRWHDDRRGGRGCRRRRGRWTSGSAMGLPSERGLRARRWSCGRLRRRGCRRLGEGTGVGAGEGVGDAVGEAAGVGVGCRGWGGLRGRLGRRFGRRRGRRRRRRVGCRRRRGVSASASRAALPRGSGSALASGSGLGVGFGVGFGVGLGVGLGVGFGVGVGAASTVYVAAGDGRLDAKQELPWHRIAEIVCAPGPLPAGIDSTANASHEGLNVPDATGLPSISNCAMPLQDGERLYCASKVSPAWPCVGVTEMLPL